MEKGMTVLLYTKEPQCGKSTNLRAYTKIEVSNERHNMLDRMIGI